MGVNVSVSSHPGLIIAIPGDITKLSPDTIYLNQLACKTWGSDLTTNQLSEVNRDEFQTENDQVVDNDISGQIVELKESVINGN